MAQDIYGSNVNYTSTSMLTAHKLIMTISSNGKSLAGALVQNVVIQYAQPIIVIREVGSTNFYYFAQPPQGSVTFGRLVVENKRIFDLLPKQAGGATVWNVPKKGQNNPTIILRSSTPDSNVEYKLNQCIVSNLGINVNSDSSYVQEQVAMTFGSMMITT